MKMTCGSLSESRIKPIDINSVLKRVPILIYGVPFMKIIHYQQAMYTN